jgi:hypothetical protein
MISMTLLVLENFHLMTIHQESLGSENHQTHPFVRFIHRKSADFFSRIESISEIALAWAVLRDNNSNYLIIVAIWYWQTRLLRRKAV